MSEAKPDVLVIGGGSAGLAAAVSAARLGASVTLIERHGVLGGMASASLVHSICGLYQLREEPGAKLANPGFAAEFAARLIDAGGAWGPYRMGKVDVLLQHPTALAWVSDRFVTDEPTLSTRLHTEVIGVRLDSAGEGIQAIEISTRGRRQVLEPRMVVDASGDGLVAALAGAEIEQTPGKHLQRPAFIFSLHNVDPAGLDRSARMRLAARIARAVSDGDLPRGALGAGLRSTGRAGEAFVTLDLDAGSASECEQTALGPKAPSPIGAGLGESEPGSQYPALKTDPSHLRPAYDPTDPAWLTRLEITGRDLAIRLSRFLREHVTAFNDSFIAAFPTRVGIRESRRIVGQYQLDETDLLQGSSFDDAIGLASWPMEMRESASGPKLRFPTDNRPCEIPLRALRVPKVSNLLTAGRCISASHEAQASIRVIGTCLVTGEAAGLAAALQAGDRDAHPASAQAVRKSRREVTNQDRFLTEGQIPPGAA